MNSGLRKNPSSADLTGNWRSVRAVLFDLDGTLYRQGLLRSLMALELMTLALEGPGRAPLDGGEPSRRIEQPRSIGVGLTTRGPRRPRLPRPRRHPACRLQKWNRWLLNG